MEDLHKIGGIPSLLKYLFNHPQTAGIFHQDELTVTGKTLRENVKDAKDIIFEGEGKQGVVRSVENAIKSTGHLTILKGNLAPGSAVAKLTGKEGLKFEVSQSL